MKNMSTRKRRRIQKYTRKNYVSDLKNYYPSCKHDNGQINNIYEGHKITYGEMTYEGMKGLFSRIRQLNPGINMFFDIGCGRGKLCLFLASSPKIKKTVGVELVKERYDDAVMLKNRLVEDYANKAQFIHANIFDVNLTQLLPQNPNVFLWFSNLCFEQNITDDVFIKFAQQLPSGTIICCSKQPGIENTKLSFIESIVVEMSWTKTSNVYIYSIV